MNTLTAIQRELKAPKSKYNSFGKYSYRSCEDILEAVKPLLEKYNAVMTIRDEMIEVGGRIYVKAIVTLTAGEENYTVTAFAREAEDKKGMDASQVTGTASSYARKYALNGLFLIDDTKDADTDEYTIRTKAIGKVKAQALEKMLTDAGQDVAKFTAYYKVDTLADLTEEQHMRIVEGLRKRGS
jgi:hypothetical protein